MIIGIDPGNTGALALLEDNGDLIEVVEMPTMAHGTKNQVNPTELANIIGEWQSMAHMNDLPITAFVEKVHAMPRRDKNGNEIKMGGASSFSFGMGFGVIQGVLATLKIPMMLTTPQSWKKFHNLLGKDKDNARTLAQQLYPTASLAMKKDIGKADAILIGRAGALSKR